MNSKVYKWCAVPQCTNTSIKTPNKVFVFVPREKKTRNKWLNLARRNTASVCENSPLYFCEDHFDLPNDMENYIQYLVMGSVSQVRMKPGCIPKKFECQSDRRKRISTTTTTKRQYMLKKQRMMLIEESEKDLLERNTITKHVEPSSDRSVLHTVEESEKDLIERSTITKHVEPSSDKSVLHTVEESEKDLIERSTITKHVEPSSDRSVLHTAKDLQDKTADKSIQVFIAKKKRSKAIQTENRLVSHMTSPLKSNLQSVSTSPFKVKSVAPNKICTTEVQSDSDISYTPSSTKYSQECASDCSELIEAEKKQEASNILKYTVIKIMKNPRTYIGIPIDCYYLIDLIEKQTSIPANHVLMCLKKIRLNSSFRELAYDFSLNSTHASKIFLKNVPVLASVMRPFIVQLNKEITKRNLPIAFRHKYHNVSCIIDCLEIEVQKPSKTVNQALSWSDYKKANTIKYLVACTPNGLVNYISPGYGGRITDTCLVESCDFLKCLQPGMCVMADRGFKHVELHLRKQGVQLVRPPSVVTGAKLSKNEARETKQIASLRIHIERVIRRLREFAMLKPHACLNHNLVKLLDDIITIACGLINLQDSLIK